VFMHNPFAALSGSIPPVAMQAYVAVMFLLVLGGTLIDLLHKGSARYFFQHRRLASFGARRRVGAAEAATLAARTMVVSVLAAGEFCNFWRRATHLLTMYGFVLYVVTTAIMVYAYPTAAAPGPALDRLRGPLADLAARTGLAVEPGRMVLELRPPGSDKGQALKDLAAQRRARAVMFCGDDLGDVPAFRAVADLRGDGIPGLAVCSGSEEVTPLAELADLVVDGPGGVVALIGSLADAMSGPAA